jgi:hypothetical protein
MEPEGVSWLLPVPLSLQLCVEGWGGGVTRFPAGTEALQRKDQAIEQKDRWAGGGV